jgi:hypothetical protein
MRGRTALYGRKHLAQVVAIKRLQHAGKSLAQIQELWPTLDQPTLSRMSGIALVAERPTRARREFWKTEPAAVEPPEPPEPAAAGADSSVALASVTVRAQVEVRIELAPDVFLALSVPAERASLPTIETADVRAIQRAAAQLLAELANRGLAPQSLEENR